MLFGLFFVALGVARSQSLVTSSSIVVEDGTGAGPDPEHLEQAVRQALAAKGVTGALQDEAVAKTLAAASSGERAVDLREYTRGEGFQEAGAEEAAAPDPVDQLERLAKLRDRGVISEGEFAAAKARLLSEL